MTIKHFCNRFLIGNEEVAVHDLDTHETRVFYNSESACNSYGKHHVAWVSTTKRGILEISACVNFEQYSENAKRIYGGEKE